AAAFFSSSLFAVAPKSETLLPDTTKAYVSVADAALLRESFNRTKWGQLLHDPAMQPFVEDFRHQLQQKGGRQLDDLGLKWDDLRGVPGGETSFALVQPGPGRMAVVVLVDVTGHRDQAMALVEKMSATLTARGALQIPREPRDPMLMFNMPNEEGRRAGRQTAYFLNGDLLAASNDVETLRRVLVSMKAERADSLAHLKSFAEIMQRCARPATGVSAVPQIRWFIDPFGYAAMVRETSVAPRRKGIDLLTALKNQGFTAIHAIGGNLTFAADDFELLHRTMIYAPPLPGHDGKERYDRAARVLTFPNTADLEPQSWVPRHVATYNTFNWDIKTAFAAVGPLVDEVSAEKGVFQDVLDSLKNDPQGPKVDIEKDLIGNLGSRVSVITDYQLPIGPKSERLLIAIETTNEQVVAATVAKTMKGDACRREFEGHVIWEIVDEDCSVPEVKIEDSGAINPADRADQAPDKKSKDHPLMQNAAITVAFGQLFVASNLGSLEAVLHQAGKSDGLASSDDYRVVADRLNDLGGVEASVRLFSRTDEEYRPTYELIRTGQMPRSETVLGQLLNALLGEGKEGVLRKQKIDGAKLPEFTAVSHYFGPAGTCIVTEPNGWFITGFMLDKAVVGQATAKNDVAGQNSIEAGHSPEPIEAAAEGSTAPDDKATKPSVQPGSASERSSPAPMSVMIGQTPAKTTTK
ncbi:MAG TPA: hypothetical protein VGH32_09720, partial [Pirellulales bacterium]